jgi:phosphoribosylformimino-5-aminoimidazole carboxamide ribotide isomerase
MKFLGDQFSLGVRHIVFTDINKDGMMAGPNFSVYTEVLSKYPEFFIVASGGVSSLEDLISLDQLSTGRLYGAITGKAIYEGKLDLKASISLLKEKRNSLT